MQYPQSVMPSVPEFLCTSNIDLVRRMRRGRGQFWFKLRQVLDEVSNVLWVAAPRETSRHPKNGAPEVSKTRRPFPWQNLHIECFAHHPVQTECGGRSLGNENIPVARRGE